MRVEFYEQMIALSNSFIFTNTCTTFMSYDF
jgi:hypothetical protein